MQKDIELMAIHMLHVVHAKKILCWSLLTTNKAFSVAADVLKGYLAVYVGESGRKRFLIPVS